MRCFVNLKHNFGVFISIKLYLVLEIIKNDKDLQSIPVVMLTTSAADRDRETAYANHVNSYLVKPMAFERFRALVRELCHYWGEVNCPARDRTA